MTRRRRTSGPAGSTESMVVTTLLLALVIALLAATVGMSSTPALVPRVVGLPLTALLGYLVIRERRQRARPAPDPGESAPPAGGEGGAVLWLLALPALATLIGFVLGPALYVFLWARFRAGERVSVALAASAVAGLAVPLLFIGLLDAHLPPGLLLELFLGLA